MKPIKIIPENRQQIENALSNVNGRAKKYVISTYEQVFDIATCAEKKLDQHHFLKQSSRTGCMVYHVPRGPSSRYGHRIISTRIGMRRSAKKGVWFLTEVTPTDLHPGYPARMAMELSRAARVEMVMRAISESGHEISTTAIVKLFPGFRAEWKHFLLTQLLAEKSDNPTIQSALDALNVAIRLS